MFSIFVVKGQTNEYELKSIGFLAENDHYSVCGGMGHFDLNIIELKLTRNKIKLKGKLIERSIDDCLYFYTIFIAENDTINRKLFNKRILINKDNKDNLTKSDLVCLFEINTKLESNERIYFEYIGYSMLEFHLLK